MKINTKISRNFALVVALGFIFVFGGRVNADLDKNFRENFTKITQEQCFNSVPYSVDDLSGFSLVHIIEGEEDIYEWNCHHGRCQEYHKLVSCVFGDAFQQAINKVNEEIQLYTGENFEKILPDTDKIWDKESCQEITLSGIQNDQEILGFKTSCSENNLTDSYSACRVTETVLNEFCGYQNFLTAKAKDWKSFKNERELHIRNNELSLFNSQANNYLKEISKTKQAFLDTSFLYKDFIHNYRIDAWLWVINSKLEETASDFTRIMNVIKTFSTKFIDANSVQ